LLLQAESLQAECDFTKEQVTAMKGERLFYQAQERQLENNLDA